MIATCAKCTLLYEALSEESACEPGGTCPSCWSIGWRPNGAGGICQLDVVAVQALDGRYNFGPPRLVDALSSEETGPFPDRQSAELAARQVRP